MDALVLDTELASSHAVPYTGGDWDEPLDTTPGLMLVGDDGIYFMSNRTDRAKDKKPVIGYAMEANAELMSRDDVWESKRRIFGGDDGAVPIDLATIKQWLEDSTGEPCVQLILSHDSVSFLNV